VVKGVVYLGSDNQKHGHPTGCLAAGAFAIIIEELSRGVDLESAARSALQRVRRREQSGETTESLCWAIDFAENEPASAETVKRLGRGWVADEALAISVIHVVTDTTKQGSVLPKRCTSSLTRHYATTDIVGRHECRPYISR
jgi:ADP-ribosylglycohydrolase